MSQLMALSRLAVVSERLTKSGSHLLGARFSPADGFLCFWIAHLGREETSRRLPAIGKLCDLVHKRPKMAALLAETE